MLETPWELATLLQRVSSCSGTRGRTRTGTVLPPTDFESVASTNFATLAKWDGILTKNPCPSMGSVH